MKQAKDAAEDIQKLLSLNPDDEQALLLKGEILAATNEPEQAQECFNQVLSLNPFSQIPMAAVGIVMKFFQIVISAVIIVKTYRDLDAPALRAR